MDKIEKIIFDALVNAAFIGHDKDDDESDVMFEEMAKETAKDVREALNK